MRKTATLLIDCKDRKGLVAAIANFLLKHDGNILHADQHQDAELGLFFMRIEWDLTDFSLPLDKFDKEFTPVAKSLGLNWKLRTTQPNLRVAVFASAQDHCLVDILHRHKTGELTCDIPIVISNHATNRSISEYYGIAFEEVKVDPKTKKAAEEKQLSLLSKNKIDLVILARYMQILSPEFVAQYPQRIINVHHSFLPAFTGAKPYERAYERGVKLIGATSHYVTSELDDGPIIEQDVTRISHRDDLAEIVQKGRDLEKVVLSRALRWHLDHRVLVYGNKTVVFD
jgi:formyltetrahydrofolate deformylase